MEFGKLNDISQINFELAPTPAFSQRVLTNLPAKNNSQQPQIYVGCTGWANKTWVGSYYSPQTRPDDYLTQYARQFNTVELNATHYQLPAIEMVKTWAKKAANRPFKFAPKMLQTVSHASELKHAIATMQQFCEHVRYFEQQLGLVFTQLPERAGLAQKADIEHYLRHFPADIPHALELRHGSFFANTDEKAFAELLAQYNCSAVITDVAGRRDVLHQYLCNDTTVVRFVGNQNPVSDQKRIIAWVEKLKEWVSYGLKNIYFFCHQPDNSQAAELATFLCGQIHQQTNWAISPPRIWQKPENPLTLF